MAASRQPVIDFLSLPLNFFARPAQIVGPDLVGCRLVKSQDNGSLLWGVIVAVSYTHLTLPTKA